MTNLITKFRRLLSWLAEPEYRSDVTLAVRDWADLPPHHPCAS
jgi:hypothetical protein